MIDCQDKGNNIEGLERMFCAFYQDERSSDELANADPNMLDLSTVLIPLRIFCAHKHQMDQVNFRSMAQRP
ncbi:hypothetical protein ACRRTK_021806 [Alexandromys fortis]